MITTKEIEHLAKLARIELLAGEALNLTREVDSILGYVGQITGASGGLPEQAGIKKEMPILRNVMRDDAVTNTSGEYTEKLLNNAPSREGQYLKVKKIL